MTEELEERISRLEKRIGPEDEEPTTPEPEPEVKTDSLAEFERKLWAGEA